VKVLFLPLNIASMPAITAEALNKVPGVEAKCLVQHLNKYNSVNDFTVYLPKIVSRKNPIKWIKHRLSYKRKIKQLILWADVLHYFWSSALDDGEDLQWANDMNKPILIEWLGSDIRNPELLKNYNPFFPEVYNNGYEYHSVESEANSTSRQMLFSRFHATPVLCPEMILYLKKDAFPTFKSVFQRIDCCNFEIYYPNPQKKIPIIVHSPTAAVAKGTNIILSVIEELRHEYQFEFILLHNLTRKEVLEKIMIADIFLDQLIIGGYGMAAMEAMSFGKPVLTYVMPKVYELGLPANCPIVNTNPENLKAQLIKLITNGQLRHEIGQQSRMYIEEYHDADKLSHQLLNIYKELI
jgi:glycosyltransferase involved in cell wall biosynthesis